VHFARANVARTIYEGVNYPQAMSNQSGL